LFIRIFYTTLTPLLLRTFRASIGEYMRPRSDAGRGGRGARRQMVCWAAIDCLVCSVIFLRDKIVQFALRLAQRPAYGHRNCSNAYWARPILSDRCLSFLPCMCVTLVYCGQTVGWIRNRMSLGMEVGLGPGGVTLDGDPASHHRKGQSSPHFSAHFAVARSPISATAELLFDFAYCMLKFGTANVCAC